MRSGWVTTRAISCPASRSSFNVGWPNVAVPAKTMRSLGADEFRFFLLLLRLDLTQGIETGQPIGEQDAVEVVDLVLDGAGQQGVALDLDLLALTVQPPGYHLHVALDLAHVARHREAAFQADL